MKLLYNVHQFALRGLISFGPVLGAAMALIVWGMFFQSLPLLVLLVVAFGYVGAVMYSWCSGQTG